jgi:hypothetical protein
MWNNLSSKKENVIKEVVWLPYKILFHYKCTYCQKVTDEKDGSCHWPVTE